MKTATTIFSIFGVIAISLFFQSCTGQPYSVEQSVLVDLTDSFLAKPDVEMHRKLFENKDVWNGYRFRISTITDINYNAAQGADIAPDCKYLSNIFKRKKKMKIFYEEMDSAFASILQTPSGKTKSTVYFPMTLELSRLSKSEAQRKILTVYSDLMEHSSLVSFYDKKIVQMLKESPDSVKKVLETQISLPNLSGIDVYFVHEPRNAEESNVFFIVSGFFKKWFESQGAKVNIGANFSAN